MRKAEFLKEMANKLQESMPKKEIEEQIRYYSDYITSEVARGKTESEVLEQLGDPILLARNILSTQEMGKPHREMEKSDAGETHRATHVSGNGGLIAGIIVVLAVCAILWLAGTIFRVLAPVIVPLMVIGAIIIMIRQRR